MLDVKPADGWAAVQQAFRRKVQSYHPDRAAGNPVIEKIAAKRFAELNESFEELRRFYRIFGDLPPMGLNATAVGSGVHPSSPTNTSRNTSQVNPKTMQPTPAKLSFNWTLLLSTIMLVIIVALFALLLL